MKVWLTPRRRASSRADARSYPSSENASRPRSSTSRSAGTEAESPLGRPVLELAYPFGAHDLSVRRDVAFAGYRMAFAARPEPVIDRFRLSRCPISAQDSLEIFRWKTFGWTSALYRAYDRAPQWVRGRARALLRQAGVASRTR